MGTGGLNQNINSQEFQKQQLQRLANGQYNDPIRHIQPRFLNFANSTKWLFYIPIGYIFRKTTISGQNLQVPISCQDITFPTFKIGTTKTTFMGYDFDLSTRQNLTQKGLTVKFLINQNWLQYLMLLRWFQQQDYTSYTRQSNIGYQQKQYNKYGDPANIEKVVVDNRGFRTQYDLGKNFYGSTQGPMVPCNLYLMDNFNNRICRILFQNCWLTEISNVPLSYRKSSNTEIQGTFQLKFSKYSLRFEDQYLRKLFGKTGISQQTL